MSAADSLTTAGAATDAASFLTRLSIWEALLICWTILVASSILVVVFVIFFLDNLKGRQARLTTDSVLDLIRSRLLPVNAINHWRLALFDQGVSVWRRTVARDSLPPNGDRPTSDLRLHAAFGVSFAPPTLAWDAVKSLTKNLEWNPYLQYLQPYPPPSSSSCLTHSSFGRDHVIQGSSSSSFRSSSLLDWLAARLIGDAACKQLSVLERQWLRPVDNSDACWLLANDTQRLGWTFYAFEPFVGGGTHSRSSPATWVTLIACSEAGLSRFSAPDEAAAATAARLASLLNFVSLSSLSSSSSSSFLSGPHASAGNAHILFPPQERPGNPPTRRSVGEDRKCRSATLPLETARSSPNVGVRRSDSARSMRREGKKEKMDPKTRDEMSPASLATSPDATTPIEVAISSSSISDAAPGTDAATATAAEASTPAGPSTSPDLCPSVRPSTATPPSPVKGDVDEVGYQVIANQSAADLLAEVLKASLINLSSSHAKQREATDGWFFAGMEKDVVILKKDLPKEANLVCYLGKGVIPVPPNVVCKTLRNPQSRFMYDEQLKKLNILHEFVSSSPGNSSSSSDLKILHMHHEISHMLRRQTRDTCALQCYRVHGERHVISLRSVMWPTCPDMSDARQRGAESGSRMTLLPSGWVIEPITGSLPGESAEGQISEERVALISMVSYLFQVDLGGGEESDYSSADEGWTSFVKKQPNAISHLRQYLAPSDGSE